jgi:hypothetical protein
MASPVCGYTLIPDAATDSSTWGCYPAGVYVIQNQADWDTLPPSACGRAASPPGVDLNTQTLVIFQDLSCSCGAWPRIIEEVCVTAGTIEIHTKRISGLYQTLCPCYSNTTVIFNADGTTSTFITGSETAQAFVLPKTWLPALEVEVCDYQSLSNGSAISEIFVGCGSP